MPIKTISLEPQIYSSKKKFRFKKLDMKKQYQKMQQEENERIQLMFKEALKDTDEKYNTISGSPVKSNREYKDVSLAVGNHNEVIKNENKFLNQNSQI